MTALAHVGHSFLLPLPLLVPPPPQHEKLETCGASLFLSSFSQLIFREFKVCIILPVRKKPAPIAQNPEVQPRAAPLPHLFPSCQPSQFLVTVQDCQELDFTL
jgi:hypothetical protein